VIKPNPIGLVVKVGDKGVEVAIKVEITKRDGETVRISKNLTAFGEVPERPTLQETNIDPHPVGFPPVGNIRI
jgi:hypothetical protein